MPVSQFDQRRREPDPGSPQEESPDPNRQFGRLISQKIVSESDTFYHHFDALGSTAALTDSAEVVTDEYDYAAFGETQASSGATPNPFQWVSQVGYRKDETTDLYHLRRRDYDPSRGRFASEDPVRDDEENLYRYVGNDPVNEIDPSGLYVQYDDLYFKSFIQGSIPGVGFLKELGSIKRLAVLEKLPTSVLNKLELSVTNDRFLPKNVDKTFSALQEVLKTPQFFSSQDPLPLDLIRVWSLIKAYSFWSFDARDSAFHVARSAEGDVQGYRITLSTESADPSTEPEVFKLYVRRVLEDLTLSDLKEYIEIEKQNRQYMLSDIRRLKDLRKVNAARAAAGVFVEPVDWYNSSLEIWNDPAAPISYAGLLPFIPAGWGKAKQALRSGDELRTVTPPVIPTPDDLPKASMPPLAKRTVAPRVGTGHPNHIANLPFGYKDKAFRRFVQRTQDEFRSVGFVDAEFFMQGSSASGRRFSGELLDARRGVKPSDYDIAVVSPKILARAEELGLNVLKGPLTADQISALGLTDVQIMLSKASKGGLPVNFKVYRTVEDVYSYDKTIPFGLFGN